MGATYINNVWYIFIVYTYRYVPHIGPVSLAIAPAAIIAPINGPCMLKVKQKNNIYIYIYIYIVRKIFLFNAGMTKMTGKKVKNKIVV